MLIQLKNTTHPYRHIYINVDIFIKTKSNLKCKNFFLFLNFVTNSFYICQDNSIFQAFVKNKRQKLYHNKLKIFTITPLSAFLWFLNNLDISSIFALAAKVFALSVKFFNIICKSRNGNLYTTF